MLTNYFLSSGISLDSHSRRSDSLPPCYSDASPALGFCFIFPWLLKMLSIFPYVSWPFQFLMWICSFLWSDLSIFKTRYIYTFWRLILYRWHALQIASASPQADFLNHWMSQFPFMKNTSIIIPSSKGVRPLNPQNNSVVSIS